MSIMTKHWKTNGTRDEKPVELYVTTTDEDIAEDIACGDGHSLTLSGRQENYRRNPTQDTDHVDFAAGAFVAAARNGIQLRGDPILEVDSIPASLAAHHLGGKDKPFLTAVYEQSLT